MKKYWFCEKPAILTEAEKAQRKFHPVLLVVFYLLFSSFFVIYSSFLTPNIFEPSSANYIHFLRIFTNVIYLVPFSLFLFFVRFVEKRSWASMGVVRNKAMNIYLILIGALFVGGLMVLALMIRQNLRTEFFFEALDGLLIIIKGLCYTIVIYGFLLISLTNRMSMKNAILVVALVIPLVNYITEMGHIITSSIAMHPPDTGFWKVINIQSSLLIKTTLSTVASIIIMASCALLLLRTSHIWGVAILVLCANFITNSVVGLPTPYDTLVVIAVAAAILCAVLFWPKKTIEKQEGAGFVSQ